MTFRKHSSLVFGVLALFFFRELKSQDTFSIVAADSTTREVGSAGASCVDLFSAGFSDPSFLGDLLPDTGAMNTQAFYLPQNQNNARARMRAGDTPTEIINWLAKHDAGGDPTVRQYGVAGFSGDEALSAGYTGSSCIDYKNHITGTINGISYSIQGNILLGQEILDSMEYNFIHATGDLSCRLMAALQGARVTGADTRCTPDGTSSLFAFLKVAQPSDPYGQPSLKLGVRTHDNSRIEPIDSLQVLFDAVHSCAATGLENIDEQMLHLYPNPASDELLVNTEYPLTGYAFEIFDTAGRINIEGIFSSHRSSIDISKLGPGVYYIRIGSFKGSFVKN